MDAGRLLRRLRDAGFRVTANGGDLMIAPASRLTTSIRRRIRVSRDDLLEEVKKGAPPESVRCVDCEIFLPLSGVRCPDCRDTRPVPTCASCGATVEQASSPVCDLCRIERQVAEARDRKMSHVKPEESRP